MKKSFLIGIIAAAVLIVIYFGMLQNKSITLDGKICVRVNRKKFRARWDEAKVPSGTIRRIADTYIDQGDPHKNGSAVGGFFKAIDMYPSDGAGKYYQKEIKQWVLGQSGLPYWNVELGELLCQTKI